MDNSRAWWPKLDAILLPCRLQEIENLAVARNGLWKVCVGAFLALPIGQLETWLRRTRRWTYNNEMVAVYACRDCCRWQSTAHKLQKSHLGTGILHSHAIGLQLQVGLAPNVPSAICIAQERLFWVFQMRVENLLGQRQLPRGA